MKLRVTVRHPPAYCCGCGSSAPPFFVAKLVTTGALVAANALGRNVAYADVGDKKRSEITLEKSACDSDHDEATEKIACTMRVSRSSALSKSDPPHMRSSAYGMVCGVQEYAEFRAINLQSR
jgi:hypothetical protein